MRGDGGGGYGVEEGLWRGGGGGGGRGDGGGGYRVEEGVRRIGNKRKWMW